MVAPLNRKKNIKKSVLILLVLIVVTMHIVLLDEVDTIQADTGSEAIENTDNDEVSGLPMYIFLGSLLVLTAVIRYIYLKGKE